MLVNKYGFDANGSTKLTAYTNPIIDYKDCIIEFELINRELGSAEQEIFRPHKNKFNQQITISIKSNGNLVVWVDSLGANDGIVLPEVSFSKNELTKFKVVFSESQTGFPQGEIFLNEVSKGIGVAPNQIPNEPLYGNNPYPFFNLNNLGFFTGIIANFKISSSAGVQFEETFNNETKGEVIGIEQYTLISSTYEPRITAKKTKTYDITNKDYVIDYNYFYGGDFSIECDNSEIKKYGFDADGSTKLTAYTNPVINYKDCILEFELINRETELNQQNIFSPELTSYGQYINVGILNNGKINVFINGLGGRDGIQLPQIIFPKNELTKFKVVFSESQTGFPQGELFINEVSQGVVVAINQIPNYSLRGNNSYPFFSTNGINPFTGIIANFKISNSVGIQFEETFNNETKGTVIGTEQYAIIEQIPVEQQFTIGFWNEAQQGFTFAGKQTITGNIAQFSYGETATRRMKIGINGEQPLTELTLTQEKLFDILVDSNVVSSGATTQDRFVNYNQVLNNSRTLTVRVKNEDYNFAQTLFKNKVYLDGEEWQISSLNVERLGLSHRKFNMSLQRLL